MADSRSNALIHQLFVRQEYDECLKLIDGVLADTDGQCEHAVYVRALIERHRGRIQESLRLFQQATALNPHNVANLKQVGRSLALLGRHRQALEVYEEAQHLAGAGDRELWHCKGLCHAKLPDGADAALQCFAEANAIQPNDATFMQMAELHAARGDLEAAASTYAAALQHSPESAELLTAYGLLLLRGGEGQRAFDMLGTALMHEPRHTRAILAAASVIQDHQDYDAALVKYRVAAAADPHCAQMWSNAGMAFFGKQRYIAAIACLKKAAYLAPFEWLTAYNLGLAHLATGQAASAFQHLSAAVNLKPDYAPSYMLLGVALERLEDGDNAAVAYERALALGPADALTRLNYGMLLHKRGDAAGAAAQLAAYKQAAAGEGGGSEDPEAAEQAQLLGQALGLGGL